MYSETRHHWIMFWNESGFLHGQYTTITKFCEAGLVTQSFLLCGNLVNFFCSKHLMRCALRRLSLNVSKPISRCVVCCCNAEQPTVAVADLGGVRGVQMHPPLAASNVFCVHNCTSPSNDYAAQGRRKVVEIGGGSEDGARVSTHTLGGSGGMPPPRNF